MQRKISTSPRKLPQQERSRITVDAILTATARILVSEGYDTASTNRIAELAGVSIGSLYQYFPSKEAIVAALIERHTSEMISLIEAKIAAFSDAPLEVALHELVKACIEVNAIGDPKLHKVLIEKVPRVGQLERVTDVEKHITFIIRTYLKKKRNEIQPKNLDLAAFILEHTIESLIHAAAIKNPELLVDGQLEQEITNLLLSYLSIGSKKECQSTKKFSLKGNCQQGIT